MPESLLSIYSTHSDRLTEADAEVERLTAELTQARIHRANCVGAVLKAEYAIVQDRAAKAAV